MEWEQGRIAHYVRRHTVSPHGKKDGDHSERNREQKQMDIPPSHPDDEGKYRKTAQSNGLATRPPSCLHFFKFCFGFEHQYDSLKEIPCGLFHNDLMIDYIVISGPEQISGLSIILSTQSLLPAFVILFCCVGL